MSKSCLKFIFRLQMFVFRLQMRIFRLAMCIFRLKMQFVSCFAGFFCTVSRFFDRGLAKIRLTGYSCSRTE